MKWIPLVLITLIASCKSDEMDTKKYEGVWNFSTSQNCSNVMSIEAISDNQVKINWTYCMQGSCIATISGNSISVAQQQSGATTHQGSGTITKNSINFPSYRFSSPTGSWIMNVSATK